MKRFAVLVALVLAATAQGVSAQTLKAVKDRGMLNCGANGSLAGFGLPDAQGKWAGLDVDFCRAIAAAVLNDANKVKYVPLSAKDRFTALQSGEGDVLSRNTTWTITRDTSLGLNFVGVNYYDGQGFMVRKGGAAHDAKKVGKRDKASAAADAKKGGKATKASRAITSAKQLNGATVCVQPGTTTELNLADYFRANRMRMTPVVIEQPEEVRQAFISGRCDAYTNDASSLASFRTSQGKEGEQFVLLPE